jgi:hypothetical protein
MKNRRVRSFLGVGNKWEGEGIRVTEVEYGGCILYSYMKIEE